MFKLIVEPINGKKQTIKLTQADIENLGDQTIAGAWEYLTTQYGYELDTIDSRNEARAFRNGYANQPAWLTIVTP
jgi:hypothetical protein